MSVRVGQKVVCIDDKVKPGKESFTYVTFPYWIKEGTTYTVRALLDNDDIVPGLLLKELKNPTVFITLLNREQEPAFSLHRFKPLDEYEEEEEQEEKEFLTIETMVEEILKL